MQRDPMRVCANACLNPYLVSALLSTPGAAQHQEDVDAIAVADTTRLHLKHANSKVSAPSVEPAVATLEATHFAEQSTEDAAAPAVADATGLPLKDANSKVGAPSVEGAVATVEATAAGKDPFSLIYTRTHMCIYVYAKLWRTRDVMWVYAYAYLNPFLRIPCRT